MYWNTNSVSSSHLETLLNKDDVTLQELMDEDEVLQECKSQNKRLIDYLIRSDVLEELVTLTTVEPSGDCDENMRYKYPNIACELLTCEVPVLNQRLANDEALLGKLYSFLEADSPLNPLLASFFSKTFSVLIARTSDQNWYSYQLTCLQVFEFLKSKENCVSLLLKHLGTSAIMDLLFKLITKVEGVEMKQNILNWLDDQHLVQNVVALLDPSVESDVHCNAAQLLCDVIRTARENRKQFTERTEQDRILDRIESSETVSQLLDYILKEPKNETSIVGGISVLLTLLEHDRSESFEGIATRYVHEDDAAENKPPKVVLSTIEAISPRLKDFHDVLINPPLKPAVKTTIGLLDPPLGNTRVEVTRLLSVLVANNNAQVNKELATLGTINVLLDLFFKYTWNNFLHTQVEQCLAYALNTNIPPTAENQTEDSCLIAHILVKCRLLSRILEAWEDNEVQQTTNKSPRRGYMGHLINISNNIVQQAEKGPLGAFMKETVDNETLEKWETFVTTKLAEVNETYKTCLGGVNVQANSADNSAEYKDIPFTLESNMLEFYANFYDLHALGPSFTEPFGSFHEEQSNDNEDVLNTLGDSGPEKLPFQGSEGDDDPEKAVLFEQVCAQKFQTLDEDDNYIWNKESQDKPKGDWPETAEQSSSGEEDDEEENNDDEPHVEGERIPTERTGAEESEGASFELNKLASETSKSITPLEEANPWEGNSFGLTNINSATSPEQGWANFETAPFVADFSLNIPPTDINTTIASSGSCEIKTLSLDLTPSENVSVEDMFSNETSEMEKAEIAESVPSPIVYANVCAITDLFDKIDLNAEKEKKEATETETEAEAQAEAKADAEAKTGVDGDVKAVEESSNSQVNNIEKPEASEDLSSLLNTSDQKELINNFKFLSAQGLISKCEQSSENEIEPQPQPQNESGDGYQLLKENVQVVPNQTTQTR